MARNWFGGGLPDFTIALGADVSAGDLDGKYAVVVGGVIVTFWNDRTGGSRYTDLLDGELNPITQVTVSNGTDGLSLGQIPRFLGPDGITEMWAAAGDAPRQLIVSPAAGSGGGIDPDLLDDYVAKADYSTKGAMLVAAGDGQPSVLEPGPDGSVPIYDSSESTGMRTELVSLFGNMLFWTGSTYEPAPLRSDTSKPRLFVGPTDPETVDGVVLAASDWKDLWIGG